ncbi:MAG: YhjD/YihY/BrkB family envelope integrity protein [Bacteroidia bacterium]
MAKIGIKKISAFFTTHLFRMKLEKYPKWQRGFIHVLRLIVLGIKGYLDKNLAQRASALTMYTVLSIVPVIAMIFGIAQGFGLEDYLTQQLKTAFAGQPDVLNNLLSYSHNMLGRTHGGWIAGFGLVLLIWSVVQVLGNIESAFNAIWFVKKGRTWVRKFTDYLAIMMIAPILMIVQGAVTVFITAYIKQFAILIEPLNDVLKNLIMFTLNLIPYLSSGLLFFMVYLVMPNTRVKPHAALVAGIIAGVFSQIFQWIYLASQVGISRYNGIYGSFASIPLFLTWLQYSWIIVLVGAEIAYCVQNVIRYETDLHTAEVSHKMRMLYALYVMNFISKKFKDGMPSSNAEEISRQLEIPLSLCRELLEKLMKSGLLTETIDPGKIEHTFVPAMNISHFTIGFIINKLESDGEYSRKSSSDILHHIKVKYLDLENAMLASSSNKNIVEF